MLIAIVATILIIISVFVIPALGNIKTPSHLSGWYFGNFIKSALIVGLVIIGIIWLVLIIF